MLRSCKCSSFPRHNTTNGGCLKTGNSSTSTKMSLREVNQSTCVDGERYPSTFQGEDFSRILAPALCFPSRQSSLEPRRTQIRCQLAPGRLHCEEGIGVADGAGEARGIFRKQRSWLAFAAKISCGLCVVWCICVCPCIYRISELSLPSSNGSSET